MTSVSRRIAAILAVVWLNMAVLPCAMAFSVDDGCPNYQPAAEQELAHHGQASDANCKTLQSDCCDLAAANANTRASKIENLSDDLELLLSPTQAWPALAAKPIPVNATRPPDPDWTHPSLHVLNCVYLK